MEYLTETLAILIIGILFFYSQGALAGVIRCGNELVQEGDSANKLSQCQLEEGYRVQNENADIVTAKDKYGQKIIIIDGKVQSIGR